MVIYFVLVVGGPMWREADSQSPRPTSQPDPRPPLTCQRVRGGAQVRGTANGCKEGAETESEGWGTVSALEAPPMRPASPSWEISRGASPTVPPPVLAPSRESQASGAQNSGFPEPSAGPLPPTRDTPSLTGNPGEMSPVCAFDAAPFQPGADRASQFRQGAEFSWVPPQAGAPRGPQGPQERSDAILTSRRLPP